MSDSVLETCRCHDLSLFHAVRVGFPKDVYDALRTYAYATDSTLNDAVLGAIVDFLAARGGKEEVDAFLKDARKQYRVALDKLSDL